MAVIMAVVLNIVVSFLPGAFAGISSSSNEPWKELGVSKKEYMQVYNYHKYGEWGE